MDESPDDLDLEPLLGSELHIPEPRPGFRESLLLRTGRLVEIRARRARWARRGIAGAAAALLFVAGFAAARLLDEPRAGAPLSVSSPDRPVAPIAATAPIEPTAPEEIRRQVSRAPAGERRVMLRRAGDAYLARGDLDGALECYRQVMELDGTKPRAAAEPEDAWLLAALRRSRDTENRRGS